MVMGHRLVLELKRSWGAGGHLIQTLHFKNNENSGILKNMHIQPKLPDSRPKNAFFETSFSQIM